MANGSNMFKPDISHHGFTGFGGPSNPISDVTGISSPGDYIRLMTETNGLNQLRALSEGADGGLIGMLAKRPTIETGIHIGKDTTADNEDFQRFNKNFVESRWRNKQGAAGGDYSEYLNHPFKDSLDKGRVGISYREDETGVREPYITFYDGENKKVSAYIVHDAHVLPEEEWVEKYQSFMGGKVLAQNTYKSWNNTDKDKRGASYDFFSDYTSHVLGLEEADKGESALDRIFK